MKLKVTISPFLEDIYSGFFEYLKNSKKTTFFSYNSSLPILRDETLSEHQDKLSVFLEVHLQKVINVIGQITNIKINNSSITIYLTKYPIRTFSSPIIIYPRKNVLYTFTTIIHEILHISLNESIDYQKLEKILEKLFPDKNKNTQIHIVIYSIMIEAFKLTNLLKHGLMNQERLDAKNHSNNSYNEAFIIVDMHGSDTILSLIKKEYLNTKSIP